jgi:Family of unknown function (DUF6600)
MTLKVVNMKAKSLTAALMLAACVVGPAGTGLCMGQAATGLPPGVQDVVKLVKAGLGEEVVLAHIRNTGAYYSLSADQIIYLNSQGVTQGEIKALLGPGASSAAVPAPVAPAPPPPAPPPGAVTAPLVPPPDTAPPSAMTTPAVAAGPAPGLDSFQAQLAPYGTWVNMPGYGLCWRPAVAVNDPDWRPYSDQGYWVYTADGWYWQSDYPWGAVTFHYGRWYRDSLGWLWVPGYDWAPAWVCWRQADGYCGWAPLPPGAVYRTGVGLMFGGRVVVDVDFGLGPDAFVFVSYDHFWDHRLRGFILPRERVRLVFGRSVIHNGYRVAGGHFVVEGLGHERVAVLTHHEVRVETPARHWDVTGHAGPDRRDPRDSRHDRDDRRGR